METKPKFHKNQLLQRKSDNSIIIVEKFEYFDHTVKKSESVPYFGKHDVNDWLYTCKYLKGQKGSRNYYEVRLLKEFTPIADSEMAQMLYGKYGYEFNADQNH